MANHTGVADASVAVIRKGPVAPSTTSEPHVGQGTTFVQSAARLLAAHIFQVIVSLGVGIVVARHLGPARLGDLSFALAITALLTPIIVCQRQIVVRDLVVAAPGERGAVLGSSITLGLVSVGVAGLAGAAAAVVLSDGHVRRDATLVALLSLGAAAFGGFESVLEAERRTGALALARSAAVAGGAGARLIALFAGAGVVGLASAGVIQAFFLLFLLLWIVRRTSERGLSLRFERERMRRLAAQSFPFAVSALAIAVYMSLDQVLLAVMRGGEQAGIYAAAVRLIEPTAIVPVAILSAATPVLLALHQNDRDRFVSQMQRLLNGVAALAVSVAVVGVAVARSIVGLVYGNAYASSWRVLPLLLAANIFVFLGVASTPWIVQHSLQKHQMVRTLHGAVLNVALNLLLIPHFGAVGAGWATVVAYAYAALFGYLLHSDTRPLGLMLLRSLWPPTLVRMPLDMLAMSNSSRANRKMR